MNSSWYISNFNIFESEVSSNIILTTYENKDYVYKVEIDITEAIKTINPSINNYNITIETLQNSTGRTNEIFFVAIPIASGSQKGDGAISLSTAGEQCWFKNNDTAKVKASKDAAGNDVSATICTNKWTDK